LVAFLGAALMSFVVLPAGSVAASHQTSAATTQTCMKVAAIRPRSLQVRVLGSGRNQTMVTSGRVGGMSAACERLGIRTTTSYGIRSDSGTITKITRRHIFAKPRAHGRVVVRQAVLGKQRLTCTAGSTSAFSVHFVAARMVERWTAFDTGDTSSRTFQVVDTNAVCHRA
jgi:hypothetical protein